MSGTKLCVFEQESSPVLGRDAYDRMESLHIDQLKLDSGTAGCGRL